MLMLRSQVGTKVIYALTTIVMFPLRFIRRLR